MQVMFPLSQKTASFEPLGFNLEKTIFFFFFLNLETLRHLTFHVPNSGQKTTFGEAVDVPSPSYTK